MDEIRNTDHSRSLGEIVSQVGEELKQFLDTRLQMLKSELQESAAGLRFLVPLALVALAFFVTAFLLLSGAIVSLVASAFSGNPYAWFFGLIIVAALWAIFGAIAAFFAYNEVRSKIVLPKRTIEVLRADKLWLESEARTTYDRAA